MYHFLSGYTAQVAGTENGLGNEPKATFSTCFGAPFMPRQPAVYAQMLGDLIARHGADCWLVNTGWTGGAYGVGKRMAIAHTRALLRAALDGSLAGAPMRQDPNFGFLVPESCPDSRTTCSTRAAPGPTSAAMTRPRAACAAGSKAISSDIRAVRRQRGQARRDPRRGVIRIASTEAVRRGFGAGLSSAPGRGLGGLSVLGRSPTWRQA